MLVYWKSQVIMNVGQLQNETIMSKEQNTVTDISIDKCLKRIKVYNV